MGELLETGNSQQCNTWSLTIWFPDWKQVVIKDIIMISGKIWNALYTRYHLFLSMINPWMWKWYYGYVGMYFCSQETYLKLLRGQVPWYLQITFKIWLKGEKWSNTKQCNVKVAKCWQVINRDEGCKGVSCIVPSTSQQPWHFSE